MNVLDFSVFIFDLDGVLINSECIHYECYKNALKNTINYELGWNEYCKIHHSLDNSFEKIFADKYKEIYNEKTKLYKNRITDVELMAGVYDFFKLLIKNGKYICIVTDASDEVFNLICGKFPLLKKSNIVITRNNIKKRKPDSACYLSLLNKLPPDIENHDILSFEDSYKGWTAACNVIYNCILVNNASYVYYDVINAENSINNFDTILDFKFKRRFNYKPFYISSKTVHRTKWIELQNKFPIISNWININKQKTDMTDTDKELICNVIQNDVDAVEFGILYLERNEKDHIGSLIEIGLLLSKSKRIYICGDNIFKDEVLFNFKKYLNFKYVNKNNLLKIFNSIQYDMNNDYNKFIQDLQQRKEETTPMRTMNDKQIDYIVICASGKGTRLLPITKDIPKLLVNVDNLNILNKMTNYWGKYSNKFIIIIDSKYNEIVDFYLRLSNIQYEIINVNCNYSEENSYTLHKALADDKFTNKKILITWCDIYPNSIIPEEVFDDKNIIFTYKNYGRYDANDNKIIKKPYGNIIGIYYFASFGHVNIFEPKMDICDCYKANFNNFITYEIENLTDIGDYQKLYYYIANKTCSYSTRYFNKIINLSDNILEKQSTCVYGNNIITNEMSFYKYHLLDNIPKIVEFGENKFQMKKILNAVNIIDIFNKSDIESQYLIITNILNEIEKIHSVEKVKISESILLEDIKLEFYDKVLQRLDNIQQLLSYFNITSVNNVQIKYHYQYIVENIYKSIKQHIFENETEYNTIHGDPHMSNILMDDKHKIWFIDPRGYFGNTKLFGLKEYDIGKIMYSLSGFDQINNNDNHFFIIDEKNNIDTNITNNITNYLHLFDTYDKDMLINMTILHWFGLTDYSKNNIHKCISSYYYGIYLYHLYYVNA
jgi:beta-phosphoglucomutase-like phosphatase (HAD superfamily)